MSTGPCAKVHVDFPVHAHVVFLHYMRLSWRLGCAQVLAPCMHINLLYSMPWLLYSSGKPLWLTPVCVLARRAVLHNLALEGLLDGGLKLRPMTLPDRFIDHGSQVC